MTGKNQNSPNQNSPNKNRKISKFLSYILRHKPESIGLELSETGWANLTDLMDCAAKHGTQLTRSQIETVVRTNNKQRFSLSEDKQQIRANQGHSIKVNLGLEAIAPPTTLYHGTATKYIDAITQQGLKPQKRHHVHLSQDLETATKVGQRHGKPVILRINAQQMHQDGHLFYRSENGVWLTDTVAPAYFKIISKTEA